MEGARTMPYKDPQKRREYRRKYYKEYYEKNPDKKERKKRKARERANAYYATNADEVKIKHRMYHAPHRRAYTESGGQMGVLQVRKHMGRRSTARCTPQGHEQREQRPI